MNVNSNNDIISEPLEKLENSINEQVSIIRKLIYVCDPIQLLNFLYLTELTSEHTENPTDLQKDINMSVFRFTEYIQSLYYCTPVKNNFDKKDQSFENFSKILEHLNKLSLLLLKYLFKTTFVNKRPDGSYYEFLGQLDFNVRGKRFSCFQKKYFDSVLMPQNEMLKLTYDLTSNEIVSAILAFTNKISLEKLINLNKIGTTEKTIGSADTVQAIADSFTKIFDTDCFALNNYFNSESKLLENLSCKINSVEPFSCNGHYAFWPIINLPIWDKPFLNYNNNYYCFSRYVLLDNFYRSINKDLKSISNLNENTWNLNQKNASEKTVTNIFEGLLPGACIYTNNHYKTFENDLLIIFEDVLIIAEIKGGNFLNTPPLIDPDGFHKTCKEIVDKAYEQCSRTYNYIVSSDNPVFYDSNKKTARNKRPKFSSDNFSHIFRLLVSLENINTLASQAGQIPFLDVESGYISISIDELLIYEDYFDDPYAFLHFLTKREKATCGTKFYINDELDHLALYIEYNDYVDYAQYAEEFKDHDLIFMEDIREDIELYYDKKSVHVISNKPKQIMPGNYNELIDYLVANKLDSKISKINFLLDMFTEERESLNKGIAIFKSKRNPISLVVANEHTGKGIYFLCRYVNNTHANIHSLINKRIHLAESEKNISVEKAIIITYNLSNSINEVCFIDVS